MDIKDLYWLAGLLEGEGCFIADKRLGSREFRNPRILVHFSTTDHDILVRVRNVFSPPLGWISNPQVAHPRNPLGKKTFWIWKVAGQKEAAGLMMTLYPLMGERRQAKIRECLEIWRSCG